MYKKKGGFIMVKQKCQKCGKTWHGWAQSDICPDCGDKLETVEDEKEEQIITREKAEKLIESKQY
jgi:rRNA maturation endonuclease Nob1